MFKSCATAGRASAVTTVKAKGAGGVTALASQWGLGKQLTDRVKGANIARWVGASRLSNLRLVDHHHISELFLPQ